MCPLRVAVVDSHELVMAGAATLLSRHPERVACVDSSDPTGVDVVLYGIDDETVVGHDDRLHALRRDSAATVIAWGWNPESSSALLAAGCGVHGFARKQLPADRLVHRIELLHRNRDDDLPALPPAGQPHPRVEAAGLTRREAEVLALIGSGYSNPEIAAELYISINSVKSYVRLAYKKTGVHRRSQAVIWARQHDLCTPRDEVAKIRLVHRLGA